MNTAGLMTLASASFIGRFGLGLWFSVHTNLICLTLPLSRGGRMSPLKPPRTRRPPAAAAGCYAPPAWDRAPEHNARPCDATTWTDGNESRSDTLATDHSAHEEDRPPRPRLFPRQPSGLAMRQESGTKCRDPPT